MLGWVSLLLMDEPNPKWYSPSGNHITKSFPATSTDSTDLFALGHPYFPCFLMCICYFNSSINSIIWICGWRTQEYDYFHVFQSVVTLEVHSCTLSSHVSSWRTGPLTSKWLLRHTASLPNNPDGGSFSLCPYSQSSASNLSALTWTPA